jgi:TonB family protein
MEQDTTRRPKTEGTATRPWMAKLLVLGVLLLAAAAFMTPALAQESSRKLKSGPPPEYPELARKLNITGSARVLITITADGRVRDVKELGGNPVLLKSLVDAVKKWRYEAATTESTVEVTFNFK